MTITRYKISGAGAMEDDDGVWCMYDAHLAALRREREPADLALEPMAVAHHFDGYGWQYIDNGSGSDWLSVGKKYDDAVVLVDQADALALVAAAYRDAAGLPAFDCTGDPCGTFDGKVFVKLDAILARTPADATAALAAIERAAYERGAVAGWGAARKSVYGLCEAIEDRAASDLEKPQVADYQTGYLSAEKITAKQIRRTMGSFEARDDDNFLALLTQEGR